MSAREEAADSARFMREVMARVGAANPTELSKVLGGRWVERDQQRKLYRWWGGKGAPNFASTVDLIRAAGWFTDDGAAVAAESAPPPQDSDRLRSLEAKVDEQGEATTQALKALSAEIRRLGRQLAAGAPPATAGSSG